MFYTFIQGIPYQFNNSLFWKAVLSGKFITLPLSNCQINGMVQFVSVLEEHLFIDWRWISHVLYWVT